VHPSFIVTLQAGDEPRWESRVEAAALGGVRWQALARVVAEASLLVSAVVLARLIPPAEVGHAVIALSISFAVATGGLGLASAVVQRRDITPRHLEVGTLINLVAGVGFTVLLLVLPPALSPIFGREAADLVRLVSPVPLLVGIAAVSNALALRNLRFRLNSLATAGSSVIGAATAIAAAIAGLDAPALVLGAVVTRGCLMLAFVVAVPPARPRWHATEARELIGFGTSAGLASVIWVGFQNVDFAIIAARMPPASVGLYYRGFAFGVSYPQKISQVLVELLFPVYSRLRALDRLRRIRSRIVRIHAILIFPLIAGYVALAPVLIPWLLGEQWKGMVTPSQILAIGGLVTTVLTGMGPLLLAVGRAGWLLGWNITGLVAYGGAVFFTTPLGLSAVCAAVAAVYVVQLFFAYGFVLRRTVGITIRELPGEVGPAAVSAALSLGVAAMLMHWLPQAGLWTPVTSAVAGVACAATYVAVLRLFFLVAWEEVIHVGRRVLSGRRAAPLPPEQTQESHAAPATEGAV
jgi:PST family polysaccharide transporter